MGSRGAIVVLTLLAHASCAASSRCSTVRRACSSHIRRQSQSGRKNPPHYIGYKCFPRINQLYDSYKSATLHGCPFFTHGRRAACVWRAACGGRTLAAISSSSTSTKPSSRFITCRVTLFAQKHAALGAGGTAKVQGRPKTQRKKQGSQCSRETPQRAAQRSAIVPIL